MSDRLAAINEKRVRILGRYFDRASNPADSYCAESFKKLEENFAERSRIFDMPRLTKWELQLHALFNQLVPAANADERVSQYHAVKRILKDNGLMFQLHDPEKYSLCPSDNQPINLQPVRSLQ